MIRCSSRPLQDRQNPIEIFFHLAKKKLKAQAIEQKIMQETFEEFSLRVKKTMAEYPVEEINRIIESMNGRVEKILKSGGERSKF